jgi:hypothetical protein
MSSEGHHAAVWRSPTNFSSSPKSCPNEFDSGIASSLIVCKYEIKEGENAGKIIRRFLDTADGMS